MATAKAKQPTVEKIFPREKLQTLKVSKLVRSFTPADFQDMAKQFSVPPARTENKKVAALTAEDLFSIDSLFTDYRREVIANFQGVNKLQTTSRFHKPVVVAAGSCCCCTPCCCCSSAEAAINPGDVVNPADVLNSATKRRG